MSLTNEIPDGLTQILERSLSPLPQGPQRRQLPPVPILVILIRQPVQVRVTPPARTEPADELLLGGAVEPFVEHAHGRLAAVGRPIVQQLVVRRRRLAARQDRPQLFPVVAKAV